MKKVPFVYIVAILGSESLASVNFSFVFLSFGLQLLRLPDDYRDQSKQFKRIVQAKYSVYLDIIMCL